MISQEENQNIFFSNSEPQHLMETLLFETFENPKASGDGADMTLIIEKQEHPKIILEDDQESHLSEKMDINQDPQLSWINPEKACEQNIQEDEFFIGNSVYLEGPINSSKIPKKQHANIRKCSYRQESRQDKIERYQKKKLVRIWDRKISYNCRKVVADNRVRINGRFIKKNNSSPSISASSFQSSMNLNIEINQVLCLVSPNQAFQQVAKQ